MRLHWMVTFLQDQTGPMWEDAVQVMFPGFTFFTLDPEQLEEGEDDLLAPDGGVGGLLVEVGAASVTASTSSIVTSRSVLVE